MSSGESPTAVEILESRDVKTKNLAYARVQLLVSPSTLYHLTDGVTIEVVDDLKVRGSKVTDGFGLIGVEACRAMGLDLGSRENEKMIFFPLIYFVAN